VTFIYLLLCILLTAGCLMTAVGLVVLVGSWVWRSVRGDLYEEQAAPDDLMAVADAVADPVAALVDEFDWHAYEYEMSSR
jgi:hypothetical protein